jgi:two-component system, NarL family, invasion response regulator UvrY
MAPRSQADGAVLESIPTNVLIADDHPVIRHGLKALLEAHADIKVVAEARDGREALELACDTDWDVAVVDYWMPEPNGAELVKRIKQHRPDRPVLVLSAYPERLHGTAVMRAGASGYLSKESADAEIVDAVRRVARDAGYLSAAFAEKLAQELAAPLRALSERETQVTRLLAAGKPNTEISHELCLSPSAVSTYRKRVLRKLKLSSNADLVRYSVENLLGA